MEEMPEYIAAELEAECLRLLRMNFIARGITGVEIVQKNLSKTGPNWTYGAIYPEPSPLELQEAHKIIASVAGRWALKV